MAQKTPNMQNPVIEVYKGREVRKYNTLRIRVSQWEFKQFIDAKEELGLSERQVIENSNRPCECCKGIEVTLMNKKKTKTITIKKGLLCKREG